MGAEKCVICGNDIPEGRQVCPDCEQNPIKVKPVYHNAPIVCKIARKIVGESPSVKFAKCTLGCKHSRKACENCKCNVKQRMHDNFMRGLQDGLYINGKQ